MKKLLPLLLTGALAAGALAGCSSEPAESDQPAESEPTATEQAEPEQDAGAPVTAAALNDGTYAIEVESSSSMFKVTNAQLTVADGQMTCVLTLSGTGYGKLFMGTGEEAAAAPEDAAIPFVENADGAYTYTVPVPALDEDVACAAWSLNKEKWYDRTLVFESASLPAGALK